VSATEYLTNDTQQTFRLQTFPQVRKLTTETNLLLIFLVDDNYLQYAILGVIENGAIGQFNNKDNVRELMSSERIFFKFDSKRKEDEQNKKGLMNNQYQQLKPHQRYSTSLPNSNLPIS
jgi:hypothetical protein